MIVVASILKRLTPWLIAVALGVGLGYWGTTKFLCPDSAKTSEANKSQTSTQKSVKKTTIKRPDGTVETSEETVNKTEKIKEKSKVKEEAPKPQYKLGLLAKPDLESLDKAKDWQKSWEYTLTGSVRIWGPVWGDIQYTPADKSIAAGFSAEF
jgi:uncharacterized protein HemX